MSLAATDWVWHQSDARGTARLVLLAIADVAGPDCTAYAGTAMLVQRTRASRSTVRRAVDMLLDSGELVVAEGATGPAGETVYGLPRAVEHIRAVSEASAFEGAGNEPGVDSGPGSKWAPGGPESGPGEGSNPTLGGPEMNPGEGSNRAPGGPEMSPQNVSHRREQEAQQQQPRVHAHARGSLIPELRPLGDALAAAGVPVRWSLSLGEQRDVVRLVQAHGVEALVELAARRTAPGTGTGPKSARYWLRVWGDLDRAVSAPPGANVVPLRPAGPAAYTDNLTAGLALLKARKDNPQ